MLRKHYKRLISCFLASIIAITGYAQEATQWTYADCLDYARAHNISLQKSRLAEETADINLGEAKAQWQPSLDFSTGHSYANLPWADGNKNTYNSSYGLSAGWTIWNGGVRENNIRRDKLQIEMAALNTGQLERNIETDLLQVYLNILYAREAIDISAVAEQVSKAQADRGKALMESGRISRVDYQRLASQYEQDHYSLVTAQTTYETRRMELKRLLELGIDSDIAPADITFATNQILTQLPELSESYRMALQTDLQLRSLDVERRSDELNAKIAAAGKSPKITLSGGVGTGYNAPGRAFGTSLLRQWNEQLALQLSIPILDQNKTKAAVARAKVQSLETQLDIVQRQTDLAQAVENWYIDTQSAQARYRAAEAQLEAARLTDELTNEQFRLGYVNTVELMNAHSAFIEAQYSVLQAKYMALLGQKMIEFYRTAKVTLL